MGSQEYYHSFVEQYCPVLYGQVLNNEFRYQSVPELELHLADEFMGTRTYVPDLIRERIGAEVYQSFCIHMRERGLLLGFVLVNTMNCGSEVGFRGH